MKRSVLLTVTGLITIIILFSYIIHETLIKGDIGVRESKFAGNLIRATEKAASLKTINLEKSVEDILSLGLRDQFGSDIESLLRQDLVSIHVFEQGSRKTLWSWEGGGQSLFKSKTFVSTYEQKVFEDIQGWNTISAGTDSYAMLVFRRLLLFPESQTEKEVVISALVKTGFWAEFARGLSIDKGSLALVTRNGELLGSSTASVAVIKSRLGALTPYLKKASHWEEAPLKTASLRVSSTPVAGGQLWLVGLFEDSAAKGSLASVLLLSLYLMAFVLTIGGSILFALSKLGYIHAPKENLVESSVPVESEPPATSEVEEVVQTQEPKVSQELSLLPVASLNGDDWLNQTERFRLAKRIVREVSQELVKPLTSILGHVQLGREVKGSKNEHWNKIEKEARNAKRFIENLRTISGDQQIVATKVGLSQVVEDQLRRLNWDLHSKKVQIESNLESRAIVMGDQYGMEEAFMALIRNAIEAQDSIKSPVVEIKSYDEGPKSIVSISDRGMGIPEKLQRQIFEPFFSTKKESGHQGLGLSLARAVFEGQGAEFYVDTKEGRGTTIQIKFKKVGELVTGEKLVSSQVPSAIPNPPKSEVSYTISEDEVDLELDFIEDSPEGLKKIARQVDELPVEVRRPKESAE